MDLLTAAVVGWWPRLDQPHLVPDKRVVRLDFPLLYEACAEAIALYGYPSALADAHVEQRLAGHETELAHALLDALTRR